MKNSAVTIPTLTDLLSERAGATRKQARSGPKRKKNTRFPVVVDQATREWLDNQAAALNTSLAGLAGMILMGVARREAAKENGSAS